MNIVEAPAATPHAYGLFSALTFRSTGDRWDTGVGWQMTSLPQPGVVGGDICQPVEVSGGKVSRDTVTADPFWVYASAECGGLMADRDVAVQALAAAEQVGVEEQVAKSLAGQPPSLTAGWGEVLGQAELDMVQKTGGIGVLHMSRALSYAGLAKGYLVTSGQRLQTALGTPVVAGVGYHSELGNTVVATSGIVAYRSDLVVLDDVMDLANNNRTDMAQRGYLIGFTVAGRWGVTTNPTSPAQGD